MPPVLLVNIHISVNFLSVSSFICGEYDVQYHAVASGSAGEETWWFYRQLLTLRSWHLAFFTTDGKLQSTNHRLVLINVNLAHNIYFVDVLVEGVRKCIVRLD
jgi:hypothetical protein